VKSSLIFTAVISSALFLQACGGVKQLQGNLTLNTAEPVVLIEKNKTESALVSGPTSVRLGFGKSVIIENGVNTIELKIPKEAITGKDLGDLKISGAKAGQKVDIVSKLVDIQHSPTSYTTVQSCRLQRYDGTRLAYGCPGLAQYYVCKWGSRTVTHNADTITRTYKVDFMDSARGLSLATLDSERVTSDSDASFGACLDNTHDYWDVCEVRCIYPNGHHHDHDTPRRR